jgi:hypothetical protein
LFLLITVFSCKEKEVPRTSGEYRLFTSIPSSRSGVTFTNILSDSEYFNIIKYPYFYNGGGVAVGDIDNDGMPDIYFSSNQWGNKLYRNKGDFEFQDITAKAGVGGAGNWKTGVTMADVNGDGLLDIYVCTGGNHQPFQGQNQLYVNNGNLTFTDRAQEYGLAYEGPSAQIAFFDYDNDGDLDAYLLTAGGGVLYRNDLTGEEPRFVDVSPSSGIVFQESVESLSMAVSDLNNDGYADIFLSDDLHETGSLHLGNGDGTFRAQRSDRSGENSSAGVDMADVNEDGWTDIVTAGSFPGEDSIIKTTSHGSTNTLQVNLGVNTSELLFTDVAAFAGVAATDRSWAPLVADFDNDGGKDLFITTGVVGRTNDLDYLQRISDTTRGVPTIEQRIAGMPSAAHHNMVFRNYNALQFENLPEFMDTPPGLSNGAAYGDLDNDGDLDLVVNNINSEAFILRNNADHDSTNYINIKLEGATKNRFGIGASIKAYAGGRSFHREQQSVRGWLSSVDPVINVGLGKSKKIDSLVVIWPGRKFQKLTGIDANQTLTLKEEAAAGRRNFIRAERPILQRAALFPFKHIENSFNTLDKQLLIPHASSTKGPRIAVADLNGDKLEDVFICGGQGQPGTVFIQTRAGKFVSIAQPAFEDDKRNEEICVALFDVDGDRDMDLMLGSGGEEFLDKRTMMRLYLNNGRGTFTKTEKNLPKIYVNASCIVPADVDHDGDMDVFVGGGVITGRYGFDSDSFILTNEGKGIFTGSPNSFFERRAVGDMIQAAVWIDVNKDEYPDLVTAGDWTPIQVWINENGVLKQHSGNGIDSLPGGWWTSLARADMDNDGDDDIVAGNFGGNQRTQTAELFVADLDNNGSLEPIMSYNQYPLPTRDRLIKQVSALSKKYPTYADYAHVSIDQIVTGKQAFRRRVGIMHSIYIENLGNGKFKARSLPTEAQLFPVFGINITDIDADGNKDILLVGNLRAVPDELWRHDQGYGLALKGNGKGDFEAIPPGRSGFVVKGEGRDIKSVNFKKEEFYLVTRNNDSLLVFKKKPR